MYNGNLERCLMTTLHHVEPHKAGLFSLPPRGQYVETETVALQHKRITAEVRTALDQIQKIKAAANGGNLTEVVRLLEEKFEYGFDPSKEAVETTQ